MLSFNNRTALVTGAGRGIGKAIAEVLARHGVTVICVSKSADSCGAVAAGIMAAGGKAKAMAVDVANGAAIAAATDSLQKEFPAIDILVNNAGISHAKPFDTVTDEDWQGDLDLKLFAAIRLTRAVLPGMRERKWGRIVNVLNIGAKAPGADSTPTSVSRAAGLALTKALSKENAPHNVLVNAMLVGLIDSDQWVRRHKNQGKGESYEQFIANMAKGRIPIGRMGKAEEFARMACFLCSDSGSFITGVAINVDGGASPVV